MVVLNADHSLRLQENERLQREIQQLNETVFSKSFKAPSAWAEREVKYKAEKRAWEQQVAGLKEQIRGLSDENRGYRESNKAAEFEDQITVPAPNHPAHSSSLLTHSSEGHIKSMMAAAIHPAHPSSLLTHTSEGQIKSKSVSEGGWSDGRLCMPHAECFTRNLLAYIVPCHILPH